MGTGYRRFFGTGGRLPTYSETSTTGEDPSIEEGRIDLLYDETYKSHLVLKWVKNKHSAAMTAGDAVCYDLKTNRYDGRVIQPTTATIAQMAGVVKSTTIAAGGWGYIVCKGVTKALVLGGVSTIGDPLSSVSTGAVLEIVDAKNYLHEDVAQGTAVTYATGYAIAMNKLTTEASALITVWVNCPL